MLEKQAPLAKLTRPKLVAVAARERLYRLLDDRLGRPTAWISGPPGSGKTTLLSGFAASRKRPTLWYQLDSSDADVATFFYYLGVAARGFVGGRRAEPLPALTPEYLPDLIGFTRRFFRALFARLPQRSLLVLDDYHEVPPGSPLHGVITCALAELPEGVGCLVASRTEPPPECARLLANQSIVPVEWEELRLTEDEAAAIAHTHRVTDEFIIKATHRRSGGWVAGLILLLGQPQTSPVNAAPILTPSSKLLFNYFAGIFAHSFSAETRDVLMSSAFLPAITGRLAVRLSRNDDAEHILQQLHEGNYFVGRRVGSEPTYELHALFQEFLIEHVNQQCTPIERLEKLRHTAKALAEFGEDEEAAVLFGKAGDWARAIDLVLGLAPRLLMQGRWQTLQTRIAAFPADEVKARPWLQYWLGASQMAIDPRTAHATVISAYEGFTRKQDAVGQMMAAATVIEIQFVLFADFKSIGRWIEALEQVLTKSVPYPDPETEVRVLTNLVQALTFHAPWHSKLEGYAKRLLELAESDAAPNQRVFAAAVLSHHFGWFGNTESSLRACSVARPLLTRKDISPVHKIFASMSLAYASYVRADHEEADALFARTFELAEEHGLSHIEFWVHAADCWHRLDRGEYKAVASILGKLEVGLAAGRGMDVAHFHLVKGWHALLIGNLPLARQELETANALAAQAGAYYTESYHILMLAEVLIELGEYALAEDWMARVRATLRDVRNFLFEFSALLVDAYGALAKRDDARCVAVLRAAFLIGRTHGYVTTLNWYGKMMSRLCAFALEHDIEVEYVRMLIRRRQLRPEAPLERWPWPVKIYTLERFEVRTDGEPLHFEGKAQRKPMELAKVLVALGGRDIPVDKLIDILWPGPSESDGQKTFDITVHRLRKLLRSDEAIQVADRRATLNPQVVWVDVWALERTLAPLIGAVNAAEPGIGLLEAAAPQVLDLYRGHFLAGETEEPWHIPIRNRLSGRFERFALRLGEHWESQRQWRRAFELYQRAVDLDPLAEAFYRHQMICLQAQGQRAEAIEVYRRCRQMLSVTVGVAPTAETEAVYRALRVS
jgi:LuxR family maltose regulon positive regulatory protein